MSNDMGNIIQIVAELLLTLSQKVTLIFSI